ncbi:MAG: hypothetical protein GXO65_05995 [Euryarchaeota archaeon]|nr:hypothetical protein [Euryarchaeota archaeon]
MGVDANPVTVTWMGGIGIAALVASYLLVNERTRQWSDKRIVLVALAVSFSLVLSTERYLGLL